MLHFLEFLASPRSKLFSVAPDYILNVSVMVLLRNSRPNEGRLLSPER